MSVSVLSGWLSALPPQMRDPVLFAIPFFLLLLTLEWTAARKLERITAENSRMPNCTLCRSETAPADSNCI